MLARRARRSYREEILTNPRVYPRERRIWSGDPGNSETLNTALTLVARRVAQVELDAKAAEVAAPALATMDGSLHALPSKPAPGLDDMDGSLYNLRAFG